MTAPTLPRSTEAAPAVVRNSAWLVIWICWFGLFAEGYEMGALGAVLPGLMAYPAWSLSPGVAGMIASAALVGMFFGGYAFGVISDRFGRKRSFITCLGLFSLASGCAALAPTPGWLAAFRFIAGIGVGGIVPVAAALTYEFAAPGRANRAFALMYSGYSLGIFAAAIVSFFTLQSHGWRFVIGLGATPLLVLPLLVWWLPESVAYLLSSGRRARAIATAERFGVALPAESAQQAQEKPLRPGVRALFAPGSARATLGFWFATFAGMILVYGLNTWLPQIMRGAGYELGPSILFLGVFALASSVGGVVLGAFADRLGRARTIIVAFMMGACAILALGHPWPLPVTYCLVALAGVGSVSAAVMVTSYLSHYFPPTLRATAVGCCLSFSRFGAVCGPLLGGLIATYQLDLGWNFVAFALAALLAAGSMLLVPAQTAGVAK